MPYKSDAQRQAVHAKRNSNYNSSGDVTKYCKGCSKSFRENHSWGSGYCPSCRSKTLKNDDTWKIGLCRHYSKSRKKYCGLSKGHSENHSYVG